MNTKLKAGVREPTLVETVYEKKLYRWAVVGGLAAVGGLVFAVVVWAVDPKKLPDLDQGFLLRGLLLGAAILLAIAAWISLKAARAWHAEKSERVSGVGSTASRSGSGNAVFVVGSKVRVKEHLTPEQKSAPPVWSPQMDQYLGKESVVTSINEHERIILADFPSHRFNKEWLDLEQ